MIEVGKREAERQCSGSCRLPPWLTVSATVHAAALFLVILWPKLWQWTLLALAANHALLALAGLWPRCRLLGPNLTRLPQNGPATVALTFDDGPDPEVTPEVLRVLAEHGVRATFFCVGARAEAHPELIRAITAAGHRVENHTQRHLVRFAFLGPGAMAREIDRAQQILAAVGDEAPRYFRAPAGIRNPFTSLVLARLGLRLVSWTRRGFDTVSRDPERVLYRLTRGLAAGDILLLHDGYAARDVAGNPIVLTVLPLLLRRLAQQRLAAVALEPSQT